MPPPKPVWEGPASELPTALRALLESEELLLESIDAVDYPDKGMICIDYVFYSLSRGGEVVLRAWVPRSDARAPSITGLVPAANVYEKEIHDLMGVVFEGNPGLREGFFKPSGMEGVYPLRKQGGRGR